MNCVNPIRITKNQPDPNGLLVACGKCISCRIQKRREWSLRMLHEVTYHSRSVFLTLTYDEDHIPDNMSLRKKHFQDFMKRLRKSLGERKIKYFACGEYGDITHRPHYHAIIFGLGLQPEDKKLVKESWPNGFTSFGLAEADSINYVAQYIDKKYTGELAEKEYKAKNREPVFRLLSNGIGKQFAIDNQEQIKTQKHCNYRGKKTSIPRYYIKKLDIDPESIKQEAIHKDCETVEHYTGIYAERDVYNKTQDLKSVTELAKKIGCAKIQHKRNLEARVKLKQSKL